MALGSFKTLASCVVGRPLVLGTPMGTWLEFYHATLKIQSHDFDLIPSMASLRVSMSTSILSDYLYLSVHYPMVLCWDIARLSALPVRALLPVTSTECRSLVDDLPGDHTTNGFPIGRD